MSLADWWQSGPREAVVLSGAARQIFVMQVGSGPDVTLLHGFPSSSHDWAKVAPALADGHAVLAPDFLGFGASEKPREHEYSLSEQADLIESLWGQAGIDSTAIVADDYGVSVAQELLARRAEGALRVDITAVAFLNGGIYPGLHRPEPSQLALLDPERGPAISAAIDEAVFSMALAPTFAEDFDAAEDTATIWGMLDPVSGAHMAERIRERLPGAPILALEDVGHWPQLEAPEPVAAALLDSLP